MDVGIAKYCGTICVEWYFGGSHCETADVRACVSNLKAACAEEFYHADVCVYSLSKPSALYRMGQTALALCSLHQFSARLP